MNNNIRVSKEREYVIASTKHVTNGILQFWGHISDDDEPRSLSGYPIDLEACERYTREELIDSHEPFPFYRKNMRIFKHEHFFVKISDLEKIGRKKTIIIL
jgi:hypothetical protein